MGNLLLVGVGNLQKGLCKAPRELCVLLLEESPAKQTWRVWSFIGNPGLAMAQRSFCNCSLWRLPLKCLHIFIQLDVLVGLGSLWLEDFCVFFRLFSGEQSHSFSSLSEVPDSPPGNTGPFKHQQSSQQFLFWGGDGQNQQGFIHCLCKDIYLSQWVICFLHQKELVEIPEGGHNLN